ncbi:KH domain containing protein [Pyrenophora tritici-repentis]|nr:KH domain containing protein [Pyrenophora tritici-repentis]
MPPSSDDSETVYIVGHPIRLSRVLTNSRDLAASMTMATADAAREHRGPNAQAHAHNITRYLRQRKALADLERKHEASIVVPTDRDAPTGWEIYARDGKNSMKARGDIMSVFASHPPAVCYHERRSFLPPVPAPAIPARSARRSAIHPGLTKDQPQIEARGLESNPKFHRKIEQFVNDSQKGLTPDQVPVQALFGQRRPEAHSQSNNSFAIVDLRARLTSSTLRFLLSLSKLRRMSLSEPCHRLRLPTKVKPQYHRDLIGSGGKQVERLQDRYSVRINFPRRAQTDDEAGEASSQKNVRSGGREMENLRLETGCQIDVPGAREGADPSGRAEIKLKGASLENQTSETIEISPDKHRLLIGRGGETRRSLESQLNIQLDIPKQTTTGAARSQVKITGEPAAVEKAKEHILELVKGQEGEDYPGPTIPPPHHLRQREQLPPKPAQTEAGKARKGANGALPLITDDATQEPMKHSWEIVDNNAPEEGADLTATIPGSYAVLLRACPRPARGLSRPLRLLPSLPLLVTSSARPSKLQARCRTWRCHHQRSSQEDGYQDPSPRDQAKDEAIEIVGTKTPQTGTNFLNKPDGNRGWASQFLEAGHTVYILDQTARGRSAVTPGTTTQLSTYSAEYIESRFTAPQRSNLWPQAKLYTQWPGAGIMGDAIFDAFYASNVPFIANATAQQTAVQAAGAALLDRIGRPVWLVGHSQGGLMAPLIADARTAGREGACVVGAYGPPFRDAGVWR